MAEATSAFAAPRDWRLVALIGVICFPAAFLLTRSVDLSGLVTLAVLALAFGVRAQRLRTHNRRMRVALDNMSQGLCMFGRNERLVVCNQRYKEMYHLPDDVARPGMTLTGLLEYRASTGTFSRKVEDYRRELLASMEGGRIRSTEIKSADGRAIFVTNRPMADGGWVATHEDVTDRRGAERERASMQEQQERRAVIEQAKGILAERQT